MVKIIYGAKGSGKTEKIISLINNDIASAKGEHIFITDTLIHSFSVNRKVRYINIAEYEAQGEAWFIGFIKGLLAANSDITRIYIDGINRFLMQPDKMKDFLLELEKLSFRLNPDFVLTVTCDKLPENIAKYS